MQRFLFLWSYFDNASKLETALLTASLEDIATRIRLPCLATLLDSASTQTHFLGLRFSSISF